MDNDEFIHKCSKLREGAESFEALEFFIRSQPQLVTIVDIIESNTLKFGKIVGLIKEKEKKSGVSLSSQELEWRDYFRDHSFNSLQDQRNMADAMAILTGINMAIFIKPTRDRKNTFPSYIVVVPTHNVNSNNYKIGAPILSLTVGLTFYRADGSRGNDMLMDISTFRMPSRGEIEHIVVRVMLFLTPAVEILVRELDRSKDMED
jgi:hypothetical protein